MNKRKVVLITVTFDTGETDTFEVDATFSESLNARKKGGFANLQEWVEYHITWITYVRDLLPVISEPTVEKADRETLRGIAWCSQHGVEPGECFAQHNPSTAFSGRANDYLSLTYPGFPKLVEEAIDAGKAGIMRAYGLTDDGLKKWIAKEDSVFPEFNMDDLMGGYGNGHVRPE